MALKKGHNSTKGDNPDFKKNDTGQLFFDAESIFEISKPYLKVVTDRQTHARMEGTSPIKAIRIFNFFKVRGIMTTQAI